MADICKNTTCNFAYPILETECAGNSLSTINFNFESLDQELCMIENRINEKWNVAYTVFSQNSGNWLEALNITKTTSACWNSTNNIVAEMSGFWLKPITLIYPYPFNAAATNISVVLNWLNANFPVRNGNCFNYIVGQELIVASPEYSSINRTVSQTKNTGGIKVATFTWSCDCIGKGTYNGSASKNVNCGANAVFNALLPDSFINKFVGIKFVVDSSFNWATVGIIY